MSAFSPEQQDELTRLIQMQVARSDLATLVRQLQGVAANQIVAGLVLVTYSAAASTSFVTIPHGHGAAPLSVVASVSSLGHVGHGDGDATNIAVASETRSGASVSTSVFIHYVAVFGV